MQIGKPLCVTYVDLIEEQQNADNVPLHEYTSDIPLCYAT